VKHPRSRPALLLAAVALASCGAPSQEEGAPVEMTVPEGATFRVVVDSLESRGLVGAPTLFTLYARARGADREVRAGRYRFGFAEPWSDILDALTRGRILTRPITIPEGWTLREMAPRIGEISGASADSVLALLTSDTAEVQFGVPGPGLEGYLFPDTYRFAEGIAPEDVVETMAEAYRGFWTPARRARLDSLGMTRQEVTTLASIVQAEAGNTREMPLIAGVYHNRLEAGWRLEADPTVLYALGGPRDRLLFAAIDSVADSPYNTYRQAGLPPGPIGAPGAAALDAALNPADVSYMFFVAGPDGGHIFSTTLAEHNRAVADYRRRRSQAARGDGESGRP
jgi:UPF0755 protein